MWVRRGFVGGVVVALGCGEGAGTGPEREDFPATLSASSRCLTPPCSAAPTGDPPISMVSFSGGIPIGTSGVQPPSAYGERFNGALRNIVPESLLIEVPQVHARGGRLALMLAGNPRHYMDDAGHFSLEKWKARVDRFTGIDFASYINDGTIIGHYLLDEPNDAVNWGGQVIPGATLEEMAQYSKQLWPNMVTIVRTEPAYLAKWGISYRYLDAAWAQYVHRKGDANDYLRRNVADAQSQGLGLVVGLNLLGGGPDVSPMTASQVTEWGTAMLSSPYSCAFISWKWDATYLSSSGMPEAMDALRGQAQNRSEKTCRRSAPSPDPDPVTPTITWPVPGDITYGTALGQAQLNATASSGGQAVAGTFTYDPAAGTILGAGPGQTLATTFTPNNPDNYTGATATVRINVLQATPSLSWTVPTSTLIGPLDSRLLTATATGVGGASLQGTFTYTPGAGTVLDASRSRTLSVLFRPANANYTTATKSVSLAVLYPFSGFFEPVNNPRVLNTVKAGRAIPVRFSLGGQRTLPIFAAGSPVARALSCPAWGTDAIEQTVPATVSGLQYDAATGQYVYTWKTDAAWASTCRKLIFSFKDGTRREAVFKLLP